MYFLYQNGGFYAFPVIFVDTVLFKNGQPNQKVSGHPGHRPKAAPGCGIDGRQVAEQAARQHLVRFAVAGPQTWTSTPGGLCDRDLVGFPGSAQAYSLAKY